MHLSPRATLSGCAGGVERHFLEHMADICPFVQVLDLPVPQTVDHVEDALRVLDLPIAEQAIVVPKVSCSPCPSRSLVPEPQSADQLAEVPTVLSPLRIAEQIVGIPVRRGRVQGLLPEHSSTATSSSLERISERTVEQIVDISPVVALGRVRPHLLVLQMRIFLGFFRTFPQIKKSAKLAAHSSPRVPASISPSTPATQLEDAPLPDSIEWVQLRERRAGKTFHWNRRTRATVWKAWIGERTEEGVFCWHRDTRVSTYDLPPLPPG